MELPRKFALSDETATFHVQSRPPSQRNSMYASKIDPALEFPFDPLREYHKDSSSTIPWREYPYKQKTIDRVVHGVPGCTVLQAAGALLVGYGVEAKAISMFNLCLSSDQWGQFERRFHDERAAFAAAKAAYIHESSSKLRSQFKADAVRSALEAEVRAVAAQNATIKVIRYDNGDKYEGQVFDRDRVWIPHGEGTLFVQDTSQQDPLLPPVLFVRYRGMWMQGLMHGRGRYHWDDGSSWDGPFLCNEMQGGGVYRSEPEADPDDTDLDWTPTPTTVRYYYGGSHICWGTELATHSRIRIFHDMGATTTGRQTNVAVLHAPYIDGCVADYDAATDRHLVVIHERPDQWMCLSGMHFKLLSAAPLGRHIR
ncbi:hypothetical protein H257_04600 [Aphanomyces astaci]|uniref:Uncharacterized protein n=1 Tax=Aphanomyces astaci TaxID=112090 RepID=W4GSV9_APHAT|nr:hypothetical protein H257_04600 [Aphanomyces astaci]ETV82820.1 hypothetical protein H257_04600 [Aphanomyces astaci]|eukprot:XP_009827491.1 hypothetical protein H257_04600 [Aphanomyces astaci]